MNLDHEIFRLTYYDLKELAFVVKQRKITDDEIFQIADELENQWNALIFATINKVIAS